MENVRFGIQNLIRRGGDELERHVALEAMYDMYLKNYTLSFDDFKKLTVERDPTALDSFTCLKFDVVMITHDEYRYLKHQSIQYSSLLKELGEVDL